MIQLQFLPPRILHGAHVPRGRRDGCQKYFFRNARLRHLRVEQFNRYCYMAGEGDSAAAGTMEDTIASDEEPAPPDLSHRNYDELMEDTPPGAHFLACATHVPGCKRRVQTRLGCSRVPFIEPTVRGKCRTILVPAEREITGASSALGWGSAPAASLRGRLVSGSGWCCCYASAGWGPLAKTSMRLSATLRELTGAATKGWVVVYMSPLG